jgi:uncharacterized repeat protein (TIGR01451 family)
MNTTHRLVRFLGALVIATGLLGGHQPALALADQADLEVTIVAADTTVDVPAEDIQYNITVRNLGPDVATNVRVTFSINYVSYTGPPICALAPVSAPT